MHGVLVIDVQISWRCSLSNNWCTSKERVVARRSGDARRSELFELAELHRADRGGDVGHAVVGAEHLVQVAHLHPLAAERAQPLVQGVVVRGDHAPLAAGDVLGGVEREGANTERAGLLAVLGCTDRLAGVFDHCEVVLGGECAEGVHVGNEAEEVHGHQRLRLWRDRSCGRCWIHQPGDRIDVNKSRRGTGAQDRSRSGTKGVPNRNDLVARLDAEPFDDRLFCEGAVRRGDRVLHANELGEAALKLGYTRPLREGARHDRLSGGVGLLATDGGSGNWNANWRCTHDGERISVRSGARSERLGSPQRRPQWGGVAMLARRPPPHLLPHQPLPGQPPRDPHRHQ